MSSIVNDDGFEDDDDDATEEEMAIETARDQITKQSYNAMIDSATTGTDLLSIIDLLPNSSQRYGHSLTMNALIKIIIRHPSFKDRSDNFYCVKVKKGKDTKVPSTFTSTNHGNKLSFKSMLQELKPNHGPWLEVVQVLRMCDEAFNESAAALRQLGMPANRIACISHMLCDERIVACLIPISVPVPAAARPAMLDKQKADGDSIVAKAYAEIFANYKTWQKDYINPFCDGPFAEDLNMFKPQLATFKDGETIRVYVRNIVARVETILRNHQQSGHHSSGDERLHEIKTSFINPKGKNMDMSFFYAFLMLEDKDLKFASRQLDEGVGAAAGFGTVGGGADAKRKKRNVQEVVAVDIQNLTKKIAENAVGLRVDTQNAITRLFSPSPTFSELSYSAPTSTANVSIGYSEAKSDKVVVERKLLCIEKQMEYHKYVIMSDFFDQEEKKKSKAELDKIMQELEEMKK